MTKNDLIKEYKETVKESLKDIEIILKKEVNPLFVVKKNVFENIFKESSNLIINKWRNKKKYTRTLLVVKAFEGLYPPEILKISLLTDSLVNILDDLIDEPLDKKEKTIYVLEFLRVFSLYANLFPKKVSYSLRLYIEELITLAIAENRLQDYFKLHTLDYGKFLESSFDLFNYRAMDIDIFVNLASYKKPSFKKSLYLKNISRIFRALTIIKKDLSDLSHDRKNGLNNLFLVVGSGNNEIRSYLNDLLDLFKREIFELKKKKSKTNNRKKALNIVIDRFIDLSEREMGAILSMKGKNF